MNDLLDLAIEAHGGWARWQEISRITAKVHFGGSFWPSVGQSGALENVTATLETAGPQTVFAPFGGANRHSLWQPNLTAILSDDGETLVSRANPRAAFGALTADDTWDDQHLIYFTSYALWTYLMTPFLFRRPGFTSQEIEPWDEGGERWRRLQVQFPDDVPSHSKQQSFYFDASGILRRHDYVVDVAGGFLAANYALEPKAFGGLIVPTARRVYVCTPDNRPIREDVIVSIDIDDISFA